MEFSLGRDTLPSQARSVRGESRLLRRERDNAKTLLFRHRLRRIAQRDRAVAMMRPAFSTILRTAADAKSVHDHLSRHHASSINERARFDISLSAGTYAPAAKTSNRCREPRFAASPLAPWPDGPVQVTRIAVPDLASPVTPRNHHLAHTRAINPSQIGTCATMLALTSHYTATNAKHPRYAPCSPRVPGSDRRELRVLAARRRPGLAALRGSPGQESPGRGIDRAALMIVDHRHLMEVGAQLR